MLYKDLFEYLNQEHGLTILESDALEIERIVLKNHENKQLLLNGVVGQSEQLKCSTCIDDGNFTGTQKCFSCFNWSNHRAF